LSFNIHTFDTNEVKMAKREYIQRHLLIIKKLKNAPSTFEEIQKYLLKQQELTEDNFEISQRTFQRDIKEINTIYGIEIKFIKKEGWYEIKEEEGEKPYERIIEAFEIITALNFSNQVQNNLIIEKREKRGTEHMHGILYAIENNLIIKINHQSFWKEGEARIVQPIAIKEAQNRWYLIAIDTKIKEMRNFGLDRIVSMEITAEKFKTAELDIESYYQHAFGIETYEPATKIVLKFNNFQAKYIKTLPLHSSQKIIMENDEHCMFEYFMHPTNDFIMEIMKYGENVKVEQPEKLRENIKNRIHKMVKLYENN